MGDGVKEPSERNDGEEEKKSFSDIFHEIFPHYLAMGMSHELFWEGESGLVKDYRKAFKIRIENEKAQWDEINDRAAWLNGLYMRHAMSSIAILVNGFAPKGVQPEEYPAKPYTEQESEKRDAEKKKKREENQMQLAMAMMQAQVNKFNKRFLEKQAEESKGKPNG